MNKNYKALSVSALVFGGFLGLRLMAGGGGSPLSAQFSSTSFSTTQSNPSVLAVADFDRDGATDVAVATGGNVISFRGQLASGQPTGGLGAAQASIFNGGTPSPCTAARNLFVGNRISGFGQTPVLYGATVNAGYDFHIDPSAAGVPGTTASCDTMVVNSAFNQTLSWTAAADFDGDGYPDGLAVKNDNRLYMVNGSFFGPGLTSFNSSVVLPGGLTGAVAVAAGDLNLDGRPDVVVGAGGSVAVFLAARQNLNTPISSIITTGTALSLGGSSAVRVMVADATGDGKADIVVTTASSVVILPGNGAGSFGAPITIPLPANYLASATAVADFNGDGLPDLAVAAVGSAGAPNAVIQMFFGTGLNTFAPAQAVTIGPNAAANLSPADVVASDMNRDGLPDLVVSTANDGNVWVMLNTTPRLVTTNAQGLQMQAVFNTAYAGNGTVTIGTSNNSPVPALSAVPLANAGSPSWVSLAVAGNQVTITPDIPSAPGPGTFKGIAEVTGTGFTRVLVPYTIQITRASSGFRRGGASGTDATGLVGALGSSGPKPQQMAFGDFNGDGIPDIAGPVGYFCPDSSQYCAAIFTRKADGTGYNYPTSSMTVSNRNNDVRGVAVADFNRDGKLDAALAGHAGALTIGYGDGAGGFAYNRSFMIPPNATGVAAADFNGDGWPDFAVPGSGDFTRPGGITIFLNDGAGGFGNFDLISGKSYYSIAAGDFNGDGIMDLAARNQTSNVDWSLDLFLGLGGGRFSAPAHVAFSIAGCSGTTAQCTRPTLQTAIFPSESLVAGDFNGDGVADLAFLDMPDAGQPLGPALVVALANVDANHNVTFGMSTHFAPSGFVQRPPYNLAVGDADGDGRLDLGLELTGQGAVIAVLPGNGNGTFAPEIDYGAGDLKGNMYFGFMGVNLALQFADINGDGRTDMVGPVVNSDFSGTASGIAMGLAGPAVKVVVDAIDQTIVAGVQYAVTVRLLDSSNSPAGNYTGTVHFTSSDNTATLPANYAFTAADNAQKAFNVTFRRAGQQTLVVTDTQNAALTVARLFLVHPGNPASVTLNSPAATAINTAFSALIAHVTDAFGNIVDPTGVNFTTTAGATGANGTLSNAGNATTDINGDASITVTANSKAGTFTVKAAAGAAVSPNRTLTNLAGPPANIAGGGPIDVAVSTASPPITATVTDSGGNPISGVSVTFTAPAGGPSGLFGASATAIAITNASGVATAATFTANLITGAYSITATAGALSGAVQMDNSFLPGTAPIASSIVTVKAGAFLFNPITKIYSTVLTVKNVGSTSINGPLYIAITGLPAGAYVANPSGTYKGLPYYTIASPAVWAPNQSATITAQFGNPNNALLNFTPLVFH